MSKIEEIKKQCKVEKGFLGNLEGVGCGAYVLNDDDVEELIQIVRDECEPKWVSVDDRMPVDGQFVLVYMPHIYTDDMVVRVRKFGCPIHWSDRGITHWMPLPEGPKQ